MDKRFTSKDIILFSTLTGLAILIILSMYMVDRQWLKMAEIQVTMKEQAQDLRKMNKLVRSLSQQVDSGTQIPKIATKSSVNQIPAVFKPAYLASQQKDYAEGDWLVRAFGNNLKTITPIVSQDAYASTVQANVLETMIVRNSDTLEWQGLLADRWTISDDGLTFTFKLREHATFSDGVPLTAKDVVFTYNFIMNDKIAAPHHRASMSKIKSVTANGDYEVICVYKEPYFKALEIIGQMVILPEHFYAKYLKTPQIFNESKGLLMGSGPYRLKDPINWTPDIGFVELKRNPRYWGAVQPSFDKLLWKVIENDSARLTTFRNREIDDYGARPIEFKKLLKDVNLSKQTNSWEYMSPVIGYSYIGWNQLKKGKATIFADKKVRQAMTYLTNRKGIIKDIMLNYAETAISPFNPRTKQHASELVAREYDLAKAKALLKQAGLEDRDGDGVLEFPDKKPFEFELVFFQDSEDTKRIVLYLKDVYARAGIMLKPKPSEWSVMLDLFNHRNYDAMTLGWTSGLETDVFRMFHSDQIKDGGDNFVGHSNPKMDALITQARKTVNEQKRMEIWQQVERLLYDDQPYTFLMRRKTLRFIDKRIKNINNSKLGLNFGSMPLENYVPINEQRYH
ncbi:ABC transporter, substrate-binding protein (cluster 5, nickel/peptides/opines) [hydrothermal vent metagenome]|uniref:ABC transporter, substrate-binding protein (Cluster 5, nickel/peptides/opines) n=1 Tax=hydrothermal vent metagenome TaxID=652676 RepID=A0A3B1A039_9ZZZZ